ncbi:hypothetical protein [Burkholderia stagnalis]|uniref:hypothetical protein n=1 Tax=Burkholderia stagnalis TaxID=1503054 RepID=UPI00075FE0BA|nr:hypothetical protein [Burkholderia stagnalis]KWN83012.1 hypothetical protein WT91_29645 [Burkholderia stagnalis]KWN96031.1 hypothetical protein WT92_16225 [Burkholderia stagnalis]
MRWRELLQQGYADIAGQQYDLTHLIGGLISLTIPASGKYPEIVATMSVEYMSHCVSYGPADDGPPLDFEQLGHARRVLDHRNIERAFCFDRHRWSLQLPGIVGRLEAYTCYFTGRENWMVMELIDDQGQKVEYEVFFRLRRGAEANTLRLVIESAYVRNPDRGGPGIPRSRRGKIRFAVMAAKTLRGEPIRDPGRNR